MKKILFIFMSILITYTTFADYCGVNKNGDRYCSYDNGCYEYWNKNGTHYSSCDKQEQNDHVVEMIKADMQTRMNTNGEESLSDFYYQQQLDNEYDEMNKNSNIPHTLDTNIKSNFKTNFMSLDGLFSFFWVLLCFLAIFGAIYSTYGDSKKETKLTRVDLPLPEEHLPMKQKMNNISGVLNWYNSLDEISQEALSPFYQSLAGIRSKKEIKNMANIYYEKNLSHIYSSDDKVYKDLFSLKDYL